MPLPFPVQHILTQTIVGPATKKGRIEWMTVSAGQNASLCHLKQAMRATWMAGDFGQNARYLEREAAAFVERLGIIPGMRVLDVACGTGNVAVPAARKGAQVVGIDIAPI